MNNFDTAFAGHFLQRLHAAVNAHARPRAPDRRRAAGRHARRACRLVDATRGRRVPRSTLVCVRLALAGLVMSWWYVGHCRGLMSEVL
jgi:hypothetical protein